MIDILVTILIILALAILIGIPWALCIVAAKAERKENKLKSEEPRDSRGTAENARKPRI